MHKDATIAQFEDLENGRDFEQKFGRKMTPEEKSLLSLSDEFLRTPEASEPASNLLNFRARRHQTASRKKAA